MHERFKRLPIFIAGNLVMIWPHMQNHLESQIRDPHEKRKILKHGIQNMEYVIQNLESDTEPPKPDCEIWKLKLGKRNLISVKN